VASDRDRDEKPPEPPAAGGSGSIDVAVSGSQPAASSGSIDVAITDPAGKPAVTAEDARPAEAARAPAAGAGSGPVSSGRVHAVTTGNETPRPRRLETAKELAKEVIGEGVSKLGSGIGTLGEGISRLGEKAHNVPLVGAGVSALGESITHAGDTLTELPRVARTRRGGLLVRSAIVGFLLVFAWIVVIVALQVRGIDAPDFRPTAEKVLSELSQGSAAIEQVYEGASPRFQEMVRKDRFVDTMTDMNATIGRFLEITAINESLVATGPTGRTGRVSLTVAYEKGKTRASVSLHWDQGRWKLLGVGIDVPPELKITKAQREERVQACKDPMDPKKCDLYVVANAILEQFRDGRADQVWEDATKVFQKQEEKGRFLMLQAEHAATLGEYRRIIAVTEAKLYASGSTATYDVLTEYAKSQGVRATFGFYRRSRLDPWKLRSLKVVLPMPRAEEPLGTAPETKPTDLPPDRPGSGGESGSGSAGSSGGAGSARGAGSGRAVNVSGKVSSGKAGSGKAGSGKAGSGKAGSVGSGSGTGSAGSSKAGSGSGSGSAGSGTSGSGSDAPQKSR